VRNVAVNWGDGSARRDLGAISAAMTVSQVFLTAAYYVVSATIIDIGSNSNAVSTPVTVSPSQRPTIVITPSPVPGKVGAQTTVAVQVTLPTGIGVQSLQVDFGDGGSNSFFGATSISLRTCAPRQARLP